MSAGSMAARIGGAMSPLVLYSLRGAVAAAPYLVFGLLALVGAVTTLALPETRGATSLETPADLQNLIDAQREKKSRTDRADRGGRAARPLTQMRRASGEDDDDDDDSPDTAPLMGGRR